MAVRTMRFEVQLESARKALAFDLRVHITDWLRDRFASKMRLAEDAGIDKKTAIQKFCLDYAGAAKASRLARGVPSELVRWASYIEYNATMNWFPAAPRRTVGTFSKEALTILPRNIAMLRVGGIEFLGAFEGEKPADIIEMRIGFDETEINKYWATIIYGRPDEGQSMDTPEPAEPELQDA